MSEDTLPCGAVVSDLIEQVVEGRADRRTPHQTTCPFCQRALEELSRRWAAVAQFAETEVDPPPTLVGRIMRRVWATVDHQWVEVHQDVGITEVSTRVLGVVAHRAARTVVGVREIRRVEASRTSERGTATVDLELVVRYGSSILGVSEAVRTAVVEALLQMCHARATSVEIEVTDIRT